MYSVFDNGVLSFTGNYIQIALGQDISARKKKCNFMKSSKGFVGDMKLFYLYNMYLSQDDINQSFNRTLSKDNIVIDWYEFENSTDTKQIMKQYNLL